MASDAFLFGLAGPMLPMPNFTYERVLGRHDAILFDSSFLPLTLVNYARTGTGYRRYLTTGPNGGGYHVGAEVEALAASVSLYFIEEVGVNATLGVKAVNRRGLTLDVRAGVGVYLFMGDTWLREPVLAVTVGWSSNP